MTNHQQFLNRQEELRVRLWGPSKTHTRQCERCRMWVHLDMQDCQPCEAAKPVFSELHKFAGPPREWTVTVEDGKIVSSYLHGVGTFSAKNIRVVEKKARVEK